MYDLDGKWVKHGEMEETTSGRVKRELAGRTCISETMQLSNSEHQPSIFLQRMTAYIKESLSNTDLNYLLIEPEWKPSVTRSCNI